MLVITFSVGLSNVLTLLKSEDLDVQIHAVKVVANLAAEGNTHVNLSLLCANLATYRYELVTKDSFFLL